MRKKQEISSSDLAYVKRNQKVSFSMEEFQKVRAEIEKNDAKALSQKMFKVI